MLCGRFPDGLMVWNNVLRARVLTWVWRRSGVFGGGGGAAVLLLQYFSGEVRSTIMVMAFITDSEL